MDGITHAAPVSKCALITVANERRCNARACSSHAAHNFPAPGLLVLKSVPGIRVKIGSIGRPFDDEPVVPVVLVHHMSDGFKPPCVPAGCEFDAIQRQQYLVEDRRGFETYRSDSLGPTAYTAASAYGGIQPGGNRYRNGTCVLPVGIRQQYRWVPVTPP